MLMLRFRNTWFCLIILALIKCQSAFAQSITVTGAVTEKDTVNVIPFAYVVNKTDGRGVVCSDRGIFNIKAKPSDTLLVSAMGFVSRKIKVADVLLLDSLNAKKIIILFPKTYELNQVIISQRELSKSQRSIYESFIHMPMPGATSPISAAYYQWSKEGKQRQKLIEIYRKEIFFEKAEKRLQYFFNVKRIDLSKFDSRAFINFCGLSEEFVFNANDYDFYYKVSRCFDDYSGNADYR